MSLLQTRRLSWHLRKLQAMSIPGDLSRSRQLFSCRAWAPVAEVRVSATLPEILKGRSRTTQCVTDLAQSFASSHAPAQVYLGGIPSRHQFFGAVTQESNNFNGVPFAGILGFGFQAIAATGSPAPIENLNNFNRINGQFGFHLADVSSMRSSNYPPLTLHLTVQQTTGSTLTLGGFDPNYSGTLTFTPVVSKTFWEVSSTLYANGAAVGPSYYSAIDTGTTLWYVPSSIAAAFVRSSFVGR